MDRGERSADPAERTGELGCSPTGRQESDGMVEPVLSSPQETKLTLDATNGSNGLYRKQIRALSRRTVSYHRRKWKVDLCCVGLCPVLTVFIAAILGVIANLTTNPSRNSPDNHQSFFGDSLSCAREDIVDNVWTFPSEVSMHPKIHVPGHANSLNVLNTHLEPITYGNVFAALLGGFGRSNTNSPLSQPGAKGILPCAYVFSKDYPTSLPYFPPVSSNFSLRVDSTFVPDPPFGWLGSMNDITNKQLPALFPILQTAPFFLFIREPSLNTSSGLGSRPRPKPLSMIGSNTSIGESINNYMSDDKNMHMQNGTLGVMDSLVFFNLSWNPLRDRQQDGNHNVKIPGFNVNGVSIESLQLIPFFDEQPYLTQEEVDDQLRDFLASTVFSLRNVTSLNIQNFFSAFLLSSNDFVDQLQSIKSISTMPFGAVRFREAHDGHYSYEAQIGSDSRLRTALSYPTEGLRRFILQTQLIRAIAKKEYNITLNPSYRIMPQIITISYNIPLSLLTAGVLFPFGITFLIPIFVYVLIVEKQERIYIMMRMNGLKPWLYLMAHYLEFLVTGIIAFSMFCFASAAARFDIVRASPGSLVVLLLVWLNTMIALSMAISSFFSTARNGMFASFLILLLSIVVSIAAYAMWNEDPPSLYFIWPPFACYTGITIINVAATSARSPPITLGDILPGRPGHKLWTILWFLVGEWLVLLIIGSYSQLVVPSEYGLSKSWYFPLQIMRNYFFRFFRHHDVDHDLEKQATLRASTSYATEKPSNGDVENERFRVLHNGGAKSGLVVISAHKQFGKNQMSVNNVTFGVERGQVLGLLGPNGAGKTTLINVLIGLYQFTQGTALIEGFDIHTHQEKIYHLIGVCPQHEILWPELTVSDHVLFYSRLKGISIQLERSYAKKMIEKVELYPQRNIPSHRLSGGQRRRLAIAIALINNPAVLFLDEPTTGLDPEVKRQIWKVIQRVKEETSCCIILTTHSMHEADVLSDKIAIMVKGQLKCFASGRQLKWQHGKGYKLSFNCSDDDGRKQLLEFIQERIPTVSVHSISRQSFVVDVGTDMQAVAQVVERIEARKEKFRLTAWGILQTTLDDVFLHLVGETGHDD